MADFYKGTIPIMDPDVLPDAAIDMLFPDGVQMGLVPRDYEAFPEPMFDPPVGIKIIPPSDWDAWFDEQEEQKSSLEHIYLPNPQGSPAFTNLDQNGDGYCWSYSVGQAVMMDRLKRRKKLIRLNPHSVAAIIKKGRNEGGWCGESAQFYTEVGCSPEGTGEDEWPLHSRDIRHDTPEVRAEMAKYRIGEQWVDLTRRVYDRNLTMEQMVTTLFNNLPGPGDFNWWGHSVCRLRWVRIERNAWGLLILNSWKNWGRHGLAVLRGNKAIPDGALAIRTTVS